MLLGEDAHEMLHHLLWRIALRVGVVDHREVRLREREHHAVQLRTVLERLVELEAEVVAVRIAKQIELAVLVLEGRQILQETLRDEDLAVPVVERLADAVGEAADLPHLASRLLDRRRIDKRMRARVRLQHRKPIDAAVGRMAVAAHLERIHAAILNGLIHHTLHVGDVDRRRMHDGPGYFRLRGGIDGGGRNHRRCQQEHCVFHAADYTINHISRTARHWTDFRPSRINARRSSVSCCRAPMSA